jgi:predicted membrane channel-forming protein YqfA (hemolysin III family)
MVTDFDENVVKFLHVAVIFLILATTLTTEYWMINRWSPLLFFLSATALVVTLTAKTKLDDIRTFRKFRKNENNTRA